MTQLPLTILQLNTGNLTIQRPTSNVDPVTGRAISARQSRGDFLQFTTTANDFGMNLYYDSLPANSTTYWSIQIYWHVVSTAVLPTVGILNSDNFGIKRWNCRTVLECSSYEWKYCRQLCNKQSQ